MIPEFSGIERRLDELNERLARLEALKAKPRSDFDADFYLVKFAGYIREWLKARSTAGP